MYIGLPLSTLATFILFTSITQYVLPGTINKSLAGF